MSLSYSIVCFLAGMAAVVIGPLVVDPKWGDDANVRSLFSREVTQDLLNSDKRQ